MHFCIHENRQTEEPALRLLLISMAKHAPQAQVLLFCSNLSEAFHTFVETIPQVKAIYPAFPVERHWNVKPDLLLHCMSELGHKDVVYLDSDIIVTRDVVRYFEKIPQDTFMMAQETLWGTTPHDDDALRARLWGFPIGRQHPFALNSCVIRATERHTDLLHRWQDMQSSDAYKEAQTRPSSERPPHLRGAQELMTALLCSEEFSDIPLAYFHLGRDIIHSYGLKAFTLKQRLHWALNGPPVFVHSQRLKPWTAGYHAGGNAVNKVYEDTFPYLLLAEKLGKPAGEDVEWARAKTPLGRLFRVTSAGVPPLCGALIAGGLDMAYGTARVIKALTGRA